MQRCFFSSILSLETPKGTSAHLQGSVSKLANSVVFISVLSLFTIWKKYLPYVHQNVEHNNYRKIFTNEQTAYNAICGPAHGVHLDALRSFGVG